MIVDSELIYSLKRSRLTTGVGRVHDIVFRSVVILGASLPYLWTTEIAEQRPTEPWQRYPNLVVIF
jgi:hypothetical protein